MQIRWDWPGAGLDIDRALKLNPRDVTANEAQARFLAARGQLVEAIAAGRKIVELDHLNLAGWLRLHTFYVASGSTDLAQEGAGAGLRMAGARLSAARWWPRGRLPLGQSGEVEPGLPQPARRPRYSALPRKMNLPVE
jgi:hypothetical protein